MIAAIKLIKTVGTKVPTVFINLRYPKSVLYILFTYIDLSQSRPAYMIGVPMCISILHDGATPSSPQYSSIEIILSSFVLIKEVT